MTDVEQKIKAFMDEVNAALIAAGRENDKVEIVAAGKNRDRETLLRLYSTGCVSAIGENRVQEFREKYTPEITWDVIGRLQTNKVKYVVGKVRLIQSLDRESLAEEIERVCAARGVVQQCLVEINSGEEEAKGGIRAEELESFLHALEKYPRVAVRGVMAVAPRDIGEDELTECFSKARDAFLAVRGKRAGFDILSMGMSADFRVALKCGANMLRPGKILFE